LFVPFDISNSPAAFTRFIISVLRELMASGIVKLMTGVNMRVSDNKELKDLVTEFMIRELKEKRKNLRQEVRENIKNIREENKKAIDLKRKQQKQYKINDLVAIKRKGNFLSPYKVVEIKDHGRYEVEKIGDLKVL